MVSQDNNEALQLGSQPDDTEKLSFAHQTLPEKVQDGHRGVFPPLCVTIPISSRIIKLAQQFYALLAVEAPAQESFPHIYLCRSYPWAP